MSISFLTGGCDAYRRAASPMFTAMSPTRSRSLLILIAAMMARRSAAIGECSASSFRHRSSISMCSSLTGMSPLSTSSISVAVALHQPLHGQAHALLGQPAHGEQPLLQRSTAPPENDGVPCSRTAP